MLGHTSSSSPYIKPDYISTSPSSMDSSKSPLALLAATCNSIGAPDPPAKTKLPNEPPQPVNPNPKKSSPLSCNGNEAKRARRSPDASSPVAAESKKSESKSSSKSSESSLSKTSEKASSKVPSDESRTERRSSRSPSSSPAKPTPQMPSSFFPPSMADPLNLASRLKAPGFPGMSPNGICRDPMCFGCSAGGPSSHCSTSLPAGMSPYPMDYSLFGSYLSNGLTNGSAGGKAFTCNWISPGEAPCGKRFNSGEELFAHLRTHTNLSIPTMSADPLHSYASYASYFASRFPGFSSVGASRYNPYKSPSVSGGATMNPYASGLWPTAASAASTPGFFSPAAFPYYRPPF